MKRLMNRLMKPAAQALLLLTACLATAASGQSGRELIEESLRRHAPPASVYEEQTLILTDPQGHYTVRTARRYARHDANGSTDLLVMETPAESKGTAIYVDLEAAGGVRRGTAASSPVFGSNFSVSDLEAEQARNFSYERDDDHDLDRVPHFVLRVLPADESVARATEYRQRRIYLRKDNLFISRIDYKDSEGRLARRQTFRDPRADESGVWRADMILMEDLRDGRRSLLKVERRVHSPDYVPVSVFAGIPGRP
jgi:hypothetical protein